MFSKKLYSTVFSSALAITMAMPANSQNTAEFPSSDQEVSLDSFEQEYENLKTDIDNRLEQLSITEENGSPASNEDLGGPNVSSYGSDLEELSKSQREIKLLEARLKQAELAKKLWETLHSENVQDLKAELAQVRSQHQFEINNLNSRIRVLEEEKRSIEDELQDAERQIAQKDSQIQMARERAEMFKEQMANMNAPQDNASAPRAQNTAQARQYVQFPEFSTIRSVSGSFEAVIHTDNGERYVVEEGDMVDDFLITSIDRRKVHAKKGDNEKTLARYSPPRPVNNGQAGQMAFDQPPQMEPYNPEGESQDSRESYEEPPQYNAQNPDPRVLEDMAQGANQTN